VAACASPHLRAAALTAISFWMDASCSSRLEKGGLLVLDSGVVESCFWVSVHHTGVEAVRCVLDLLARECARHGLDPAPWPTRSLSCDIGLISVVPSPCHLSLPTLDWPIGRCR